MRAAFFARLRNTGQDSMVNYARGLVLHLPVRSWYAIMARKSKRGITTLQSVKRPKASLKLVSSLVLALALLLALLSRDVLLVLAVTTAIAGLLLLAREQPVQASHRAPSMAPPAHLTSAQKLRGVLARPRRTRRMAVPRFRSVATRPAQRKSSRTPEVPVTDSPGNAPVIQVLQ